MAIEGTPRKGEIWKLYDANGRTWLFKSNGVNREWLTEHAGAYCWNDGGDDYFNEYTSIMIGNHIGDNDNIIDLKPANLNECAIFERKLRR